MMVYAAEIFCGLSNNISVVSFFKMVSLYGSSSKILLFMSTLTPFGIKLWVVFPLIYIYLILKKNHSLFARHSDIFCGTLDVLALTALTVKAKTSLVAHICLYLICVSLVFQEQCDAILNAFIRHILSNLKGVEIEVFLSSNINNSQRLKNTLINYMFIIKYF